jgi:hypothetical protein
MNIYQSLEDSVYSFVTTIFPDWRVIFAYGNGPEPLTPYVCIDVRRLKAVGREYTSSSSFIDDNSQSFTTTTQNYEATVRFEFIGLQDVNTTLSDMVHELEFNLRTQAGYESQRLNAISLMSAAPVRRLPMMRETSTYMYYQLDVAFGYAVSNTVTQDYMVSLGINGEYDDAGREPTHIIETTLDINP